jgi:hypothetical protein
MIGFIISEGAELMYSILKLTFNTGYGIYNWYYDENSDEKILKLENRIEELEKKIENS